MRIALYIVAGFALAAFLAVGFVLPGVRGAAEKAAAIALIAGADAARLRVAAAAAKSGTPGNAFACLRLSVNSACGRRLCAM